MPDRCLCRKRTASRPSPARALLRMVFQQDARTAAQAGGCRSRGCARGRCHRRLRVQAPPDSVQKVARAHQESLGSRPADLPPLPARNENCGPHRRSGRDRTHPAPPRIVGSRRAGRRRPRPAGTRRAGDRTLARRSIPQLRKRTGVRGKLRTPAAPRFASAACIFSQPASRTRHFVVRGAPPIQKCRALESQTPICQHPAMETPAPSIKLRANTPEGRKAISYQLNHHFP